MTCDIYVATHKENRKPTNENIYQLVQAGACYNSKIPGVTIRDNLGNDNISEKNFLYAELTVAYSLWKNSNADIKGLVHYRRYFTQFPTSKDSTNILSEKDIVSILSCYDVILPYPYPKKIKNDEYTNKLGITSAWLFNRLGDLILDKSPEYYDDYIEIKNRNYECYCNMLIAKKEIYNDYCEWLFMILKNFEIDAMDFNEKNNKKGNNRRILGYLSELLLNVYFHHNKLKVKFKPVVMFYEKKDALYPFKKFICKNKFYEFLYNPWFFNKNTI